jgi:hypothetical protein
MSEWRQKVFWNRAFSGTFGHFRAWVEGKSRVLARRREGGREAQKKWGILGQIGAFGENLKK